MKGDLAMVGIVIPCWNASEPLEQTLRAIGSMPVSIREKLSVVVIDGGSTDDTLRVVSRHTHVVDHVQSEADNGVYHAMNKGVQIVKSKLVWFLGAGDLPDGDGLKALLEWLNDNPSTAWAHACSVESLLPREPGVPARFRPRWGAALTWRNTIHHQGLLAPKSWLIETPFDESLKVLSDYAWLLDQRNLRHDIVCHANIRLAQVPGGGLSRSFVPRLYIEEWRMKRPRLAFQHQATHVIWLPLKWAFKQMSNAFRMFGSSTPQ